MSEQPPQSIAIAVVQLGDRYLVGQRPAGAVLAGSWEFPGGKIQPGEDAREAAVRECREETGLAVEVIGEFPEQIESYEHGRVHLRFFACRLKDELQQLDAAGGFRWVEPSELAQLKFPAGNRRVLQLLTQCQSHSLPDWRSIDT